MIRIIDKNELEKLHLLFSEILREGFSEYPPQLIEFFINQDFSASSLEKQVDKKEITILVDEEVGGLVGFLLFEKLYGGVSYCAWLGVLEKERGRGVGRRLVEEWEKQILSLGGHKLMMLTQSLTNRRIFPKYGFIEEGFEKKSWFGLNAWLFGKIIAEPRLENYLK